MKKEMLLVGLITSNVPSLQAEPSVMAGISYTFKGDLGLTVKFMSDDEDKTPVLSAGAAFYPFSGDKLGLDLGGGYIIDNSVVVGSYDFVQRSPQVSVGYTDSESTKTEPESQPDIVCPPGANPLPSGGCD